nr:restriction endonuclease subunit S [Streptomyces lushanensis]
MGDFCEIVSGATPKTGVADFWDGEIRWATPKDLSDLPGKYIDDTPRRITETGLQSCAATTLPAGSVLFSSRAPIGHVAINTVPMATNQGFKSLIPDGERADAHYLYYWLKAHRSHLESLGNGATFKEVSKTVVAKVAVPLPPLSVQRHIAQVLDHVDALRASRRQALTRLEGLTQSTFRETFKELLDGGGRYPVMSLAEWVDDQRPITYGILKPGGHEPDGVPYVRVVDMKMGGIEASAIRRTTAEISREYKRSILRAGDIMISIRGHVGRLAIVPKGLDGANITQDSARIAVPSESARYVMEFLRSRSSQNWMARRTKGAAVKGINLSDLKMLEIPVPDMALQQKFSVQADKIDQLVALQRLHLSKLDALFASIESRAFCGEPWSEVPAPAA